MTLIKICGLSRACDIDNARDARPDFIGFILNYPKSRRNVAPEAAALLRERLGSEIRAVGVFVDQPIDVVIRAAAQIGLDAVQLHGHEDHVYITALRKAVSVPVWKAFRVRSAADLSAAAESPADEILLDNGYGTGEVFDWRLTIGFDRPFILAGGLTPKNIPDAVRSLHPTMVDISSGVETGGVKDRAKIIAAVRAVRQSQTDNTHNHGVSQRKGRR
ncbi:MAG: phosphoribosylanthranilate isomerase [Thermoguttaceae bacterium]|jgi:phosphoribosylanthranilate isomerase